MSVWFWLFAILVTALPCVGLVVAILFAWLSGNASKRNYFWAVIVLWVLVFAVHAVLIAIGATPMVVEVIEEYWRRNFGG